MFVLISEIQSDLGAVSNLLVIPGEGNPLPTAVDYFCVLNRDAFHIC